jgi:hypothetical protein
VYLSSSFNVELVYIILKGITKFSYISCSSGQGGLNEFTAKKVSKLNVVYEKNGDVVLTIDNLKMKDFGSWDQNEIKGLRGDSIAKPAQEEVTVKNKIKVTSHRVDLFKDMFKALFQS